MEILQNMLVMIAVAIAITFALMEGSNEKKDADNDESVRRNKRIDFIVGENE